MMLRRCDGVGNVGGRRLLRGAAPAASLPCLLLRHTHTRRRLCCAASSPDGPQTAESGSPPAAAQTPAPADANAPQLLAPPKRPPPGRAAPGNGGGPGGGEEPEGPPPGFPNNLPPWLLRMAALLTTYGGVYGTAAVLVAWFTKVDAFGGFHWSNDDIATGLAAFVPLMMLDAALMLPDYSVDPKEARTVSNVILGDELTHMVGERAAAAKEKMKKQASERADAAVGEATGGAATGAAGSTATGATGGSDAAVAVGASEPQQPAGEGAPKEKQQRPLDEPGVSYAAAASPQERMVAAMAASASGEGSSSGVGAGAAPPPGPLGAAWIRTRVGLELYQTFNQRRNPAAGLSPVAEFLVILVGELSNEMLYRAVVLTLLGYWIRDRLFEAGADDVLLLAGSEVATSDLARWVAVLLVASAGAAGFVTSALREKRMAENITVEMGRTDLPPEKAEAIRRQLIASMGAQNSIVYGVEGLRSVAEALLAGAVFVGTGNLAASFSGRVVSQSLFSWYQRIGMNRSMVKRKALMAKMLDRSAKMEAAIKASIERAKVDQEQEGQGAGEAGPAGTGVGSTAAGGAGGAGGAAAAEAGGAAAAEAGESTVQYWGAAPASEAPSEAADTAAGAGASAASSSASGSNGAIASNGASGSSSAITGLASVDAFRSAVDAAAAREPHSGTASMASTTADAAAPASATDSSPAEALPASPREVEGLLLDMMRSPEGQRLIMRFMVQTGEASGPGDVSASEAMDYTNRMLGDPDTKKILLEQLEARLVAMAGQQGGGGAGGGGN